MVWCLLTEFRDVEDLKEGDSFDVYVVNKEDKKGILQLSRKNARMLKAWEAIVEANKTGRGAKSHPKPRAALLWTYMAWKHSYLAHR